MTVSDNEVIKAMECCKDLKCSECPKKTNLFETDCDVQLHQEAIDLINRLNERDKKNERIIELNNKLIKTQSAEIERLQRVSEEAVSCFTRMESLYKIKCKELEVAKVEKVTHCSECKHLIVHNLPTLYASCIKHHFRFDSFQLDTRTHFCSLGEPKEKGGAE